MSRGVTSRGPSARNASLALACLMALVAIACAVNPVTGRRELSLLSESDEIELGRQNDEQIVAQLGLYDDPELAEWINQIGQRMAAASERPQLPWTFRMLDDPTVNAFALPGGFVYMTRGILAYMTSEAEAVGVLGHEIGHVTARHGAQRYTSASLAQLELGVGSVLSSEVRALGGALQTGLGLLFLKFGRDDERQADELGVRYAVNAGYDARSLAGFFRTIQRLGDSGGGRVPSWLSTHPDPADRVESVLAQAAPLVAGRNDLTVARDEHLRRVDGVVFGANPREGVIIEGTFKHPDLGFQLEFPNGWPLSNGKTAVVAQSGERDALLQLTLSNPQSGQSLSQYALAVVEARNGTSVRGRDLRVSSFPAYEVEYEVETQGAGPLRVVDLFVSYGGNTYDLAGAARRAAFAGYANTIARAQRSFRSLPQGERDALKPDRLQVLSARGSGPLTEALAGRPHAVPIETLALINGIGVEELLPAGLFKNVLPGYQR